MNKSKEILFAIYKNGKHLGNQRGKDINDAINKYLIASLFEAFIDDLEFKSLYNGKIAIKNIHFY
jgi:hypothetical protein